MFWESVGVSVQGSGRCLVVGPNEEHWRPRREQVTVRVNIESLAKLDRVAALTGSTRSGLIRMVVEDFADKTDELVELLASARAGHEVRLREWVDGLIGGLSSEADQLVLPVPGRERERRAG